MKRELFLFPEEDQDADLTTSGGFCLLSDIQSFSFNGYKKENIIPEKLNNDLRVMLRFPPKLSINRDIGQGRYLSSIRRLKSWRRTIVIA